jgi:hypothetical protein
MTKRKKGAKELHHLLLVVLLNFVILGNLGKMKYQFVICISLLIQEKSPEACEPASLADVVAKRKEGREGGREGRGGEGREGGRKEGRKEDRKEGGKEDRKEGRQEGRKTGKREE